MMHDILDFCMHDTNVAHEITKREHNTPNWCGDIHISVEGFIPKTPRTVYRVDFRYDRGPALTTDFTVLIEHDDSNSVTPLSRKQIIQIV